MDYHQMIFFRTRIGLQLGSFPAENLSCSRCLSNIPRVAWSKSLKKSFAWRKNTKACENCNYLLGPYMPLFFFSPCYEGVLSFTHSFKDPVFRFILPNADKNTRISQNAWLDHYDSGKSHTCHINEQKTRSNCVAKSRAMSPSATCTQS